MIAAAIRKLLADNGFGTVEVDLFEDRLPPNPINAIAVYSSDFGDPIRGLCPTRQKDVAPFLIEIRRETQASARNEAYEVYDFLDGQLGVAPSGYSRFEEISARYPFRVRRDDGEPQPVVFGVSGEAIIDLP